jgi:universal stress protein E
MQAIRRILVAIKNPEARAQPGADKALGIAKKLGASIEFFHAISTPVLLEVAPLKCESLAEIKREALALRRKRIDSLVARARRRGIEADATVAWDYPPHEAIVRRARAGSADLIIAECHEGRRLKPWIMHVTDWELLRTSPVPVLLVRDARPWRKPVILAAVDPLHAHAKPAAIDADIVSFARMLARAFGGDATVMHAACPPWQAFALADPALGPVTVAAAFEAQKDAATRAFGKFAASHRIPVARRRVLEEDPVIGIPRLARDLHASVVVMGAVSRSGLQRVFIGNTAERVLPALPCDVLVLKPRRFRSQVAGKPRGMRVVTQPALPLPV